MSINKAFDTDKARAAQARRFGQAGDAIRQGRAGAADAGVLGFDDRDGRIYAVLGVMIAGEITINPTGGFLWSCFLPMTPRMQRAETLEKAKGALDFKVREWLEAAGVVVSAAALQRLRGNP